MATLRPIRLRLRTTAAAWLLALAALACASASFEPRETGRLFLWRVESGHAEGGEAHLLGSVHLGGPGTELDPAVDAAFERADALVVEVDLRAFSPEESAALLQAMGTLPEGRSLDSLVSPKTWSRFSELLQRNGQSPEPYRRFEPWVAFTVATGLLLEEGELRAEQGIDRVFLRRVGEEADVIALESLEFQLSLFDQLPEAVQVRLLEELLAEGEGAAAREAEGMVEAWRLGDTDALERMVTAPFDSDPELAEFQRRLFADRNRRMSERIDELLRQDRRFFVVLGAAHMVGFQGIPALLEARGHTVEQLEKSP